MSESKIKEPELSIIHKAIATAIAIINSTEDEHASKMAADIAHPGSGVGEKRLVLPARADLSAGDDRRHGGDERGRRGHIQVRSDASLGARRSGHVVQRRRR